MKIEHPNPMDEVEAPSATRFQRLMGYAKEVVSSISPKTAFLIALIAGLSLQEIEAQDIKIPDSSAIAAYVQVKKEFDGLKESLDSELFRKKLTSLLAQDEARADEIISARKKGLEETVVHILTAKAHSDSVTHHFSKPYPITGYANDAEHTEIGRAHV